ncbi:MAG TPA: hypothetical protein VKV28_17330 [Candidatus Binataceae bacterium]|nr:hypothetical protein [Candidatus Binataceae bacterium]
MHVLAQEEPNVLLQSKLGKSLERPFDPDGGSSLFSYESSYASVVAFVMAALAALVLPALLFSWNCPPDVQCSPAYAGEIYSLLQELGLLAAVMWAATGGIMLYWVALQRQILLGKDLLRKSLASAFSMGGSTLSVLVMPRFGPPCGAPPWLEAAIPALVLAFIFSLAFSFWRKHRLNAFVRPASL